MKLKLRFKGGPGSGHHGHAGRPGKVGGSLSRSWEGFPFRPEVGISPNAKDIPPLRDEDDNFIVFHGTAMINAENILHTNTLRADDIGAVGFTTTPDLAYSYGVQHSNPAVVRLTIDKNWLTSQQIRREVGGAGHSSFLIKSSVPYEAILDAKIIDEEATYKGGPGSGFHGHAGRPGKVGGSSSGAPTLDIRTFSNAKNLWKDERLPTEEEIKNFRDMVEQLPPEIQAIRPKKQLLSLSVREGRAEAYGGCVYLDEKYLRGNSEGWGRVADHEYIHTIVNTNDAIKDTIEQSYNPPRYFAHAEGYGDDIYTKKNEQFTMIMTALTREGRSNWNSHIKMIEKWHYEMSDEEVQAQVDAVDTYLKEIGLW